MLVKTFEIKKRFSRLIIYQSKEDSLFIVEPHGIINPSLIKLDLLEAERFGNELKKDWTYLVNTKNVLFPNPLNLLLLNKIKLLPYINQYIIYAPSLVVRILGRLTFFIVKPNKILKNEADFKSYLEKETK